MAEGRRGRGRPQVDAKFDVWFGVQDAKERKKIQDRLAQRARRMYQPCPIPLTVVDFRDSKLTLGAGKRLGPGASKGSEPSTSSNDTSPENSSSPEVPVLTPRSQRDSSTSALVLRGSTTGMSASTPQNILPKGFKMKV